MDDESRTLPVYVLDEPAFRRIGILSPPFRLGVLRHRRILEDQPPPRLLRTASSSNSGPEVYSNIELLLGSLVPASTVVLVAFSKRSGIQPLRRIVERCRGIGCEVHLVLGDSLLDWRFEEEELPDLVRWVGSVVQLAEGTAIEEMLPGCLESLSLALSGSTRERLRGHLIWIGSRRHQALETCLEELTSRLGSGSPPEILTVSLIETMRTYLEETLTRRGFGSAPLSVAPRPLGARLGAFCTPRRSIEDA